MEFRFWWEVSYKQLIKGIESYGMSSGCSGNMATALLDLWRRLCLLRKYHVLKGYAM
jgi:hypothetical protein